MFGRGVEILCWVGVGLKVWRRSFRNETSKNNTKYGQTIIREKNGRIIIRNKIWGDDNPSKIFKNRIKLK